MSKICDDLRASILQAAMQGKLTKQLPEDGNAEELLELIKAKKKTNNKTRPVTEKDILFEIPDTWKWVRFGEIVDFNMGKTPPRADTSYWGNDIPWISIADMPDGNILLETKEKISNKAFIEIFKSKICPKDTLIMSFKLTVGRCSILGIDAVHNEAIISIFPIVDQEFSCRNYLANMLPFLTNYGETKDAIKGRTLNSESLNNLLIPLPPLAEQKRIVAKVDELMARVADLEKSADALASLKSHYPDEMRASLLQAAMQGKLTERLPSDGSADELLKRIQVEKEQLIASGKTKKSKSALAPPTPDEIPFPIPDTWEWVYLDQISILLGGNAFKGNELSKEKKTNYIRVIRISDFDNSGLNDKNPVYTLYSKQYDNYRIKEKDILMCMTGGTVGKCCILNICGNELFLNQRVADIRTSSYVLPDYIHICLNSPAIQQVIQTSKNSTNDNISAELIRNFPIPLPPIAEQKRIVDRLDEAMKNIDTVATLIASE